MGASFSPDTPSDCGLKCWLYHLQIAIPGADFGFDFLGVKVEGEVRNITCSQITLGDVKSDIINPMEVQLQVNGLGITCVGAWAYDLGGIKDSGPLSVIVTSSSIDLAIVVDKTADGLLAKDTRLTKCDPAIFIQQISFGNGKTGELWDLIEQAVLPILDVGLTSVITSELTTLVDVNITNLIQTIDALISPFLPPVPPDAPPDVPTGTMNFLLPPNPLIALLDYVLDDVVGANGIISVNKLVDAFTDNTGSFTKSVPCSEGGFIHIPIPFVPDGAEIVLGLCTVYVSGLDTWTRFDLLRPILGSNHSLTTHTATDELHLNITFFLNISLTDGPLTGQNLYEEAVFSTKIKDSRLQLDALVALNHELFANLALPNDILAPGGACVFRELWNLNFTYLLVNFTVQDLFLIALADDPEKQIDEAITKVVGMLISSFDLAIPAMLNGIVAGPVRSLANVYINETLDNMHNQTVNGEVECGVPAEFPDTFDQQSTIISFSAALGGFFLLVIYLIIVMFIASKGGYRQQASAADPAGESLLSPGKASLYDNKSLSAQHPLADCLALDERLHWIVRYGVPLVILLNIALFAASNTSVGASVTAVLVLGNETKELPPLFTFSLANTVEDMWHAKVYALSILIALLSGGWPYLKLVLMLVCWVLPTRALSMKGREIFLMILDALGKWSLIDAFVMVIMMTVFSITITDPGPGHNGAINVYVVPNFGFHTFMIATMSSLAITHIILAFHRRVKKLTLEAQGGATTDIAGSTDSDAEGPALGAGGINDDVEAISDDDEDGTDGQFGETNQCLNQPLFMRSFKRCNRLIGAVITVLLLLCMGLLIGGSVIDSFQFEVQGLAGIVIDVLGGSAVRTYSVIDVGLDLPSSVQNPNSIQVRWIQAAFFILVMGVPLGTLLSLLVLWVLPLSIRLQRAIFHMTEVLHAWSALEVYLLAEVAALLEISQFAEFIIGDKCDLINELLKTYFSSQMSDPICFGVNTLLITSFWYLLGAAVIYMATAILVMWVCHKALDKYDEKHAKRGKNAALATERPQRRFF